MISPGTNVRVCALVLLVCTLVCSVAALSGAADAKDAFHYYQVGDWQRAAALYEASAAGHAGADVLAQAAEANYRAGKYDRAEELALRCLAAGERTDVRILLSLISAGRGNGAGAVRALEALRPVPADEHKVLTAIGTIRSAGDQEAALGYLRKAVEQDPEDFWAWFTIGLIHEDHEDFEQATKAYKQAVRINPMHAQAQNNLGYSYKERHFYAYALEHYLKAIELMPDNPGFHYNIGNVYTYQARIEEAFNAYKKALELDPSFAKAHYNMGRTYLRKDMVQEAIDEFRLYLRDGDRKVFREVASRSAVEDEIEALEFYLKLNPPGKSPEVEAAR